MVRALAVLALAALWLPATTVLAACLCGHGRERAAAHDEAGCSCPIHAGRGGAGAHCSHGNTPVKTRCSMQSGADGPTGTVTALASLLRPAVLAAIAPLSVPGPGARLAERAALVAALDAPAPPTPPPRSSFRAG